MQITSQMCMPTNRKDRVYSSNRVRTFSSSSVLVVRIPLMRDFGGSSTVAADPSKKRVKMARITGMTGKRFGVCFCCCDESKKAFTNVFDDF